MNIADYILKDFNPLHINNTIKEALVLCEGLTLTHIPIIKDGIFAGTISQSDLLTIENQEQQLSDFVAIFEYFQVNAKESVLELLKNFANNDTNSIPVIVEKKYMGYFELNAILDVFSQSPFLNTNGFILNIEKNKKDYSFSEVTQIAESNNGLLLGCYISNQTTDKVELTLKIASDKINEIIQTFRRYNYTIITEHKDDYYLEELKNRSEYLQKFLNT
ncbi:MAG: acetoin utilization protein acuB [Flavobacteriaceae bacterium]|nr:acetoin utilization protein acuB [Flavobacteriaceae bacterium]